LSDQFQRGLWATLGAFLIWGVFPIYWKWLDRVPALEIMAHRLAWCFVFVAGYLCLRGGLGWWRHIVARPRLVGLLSASAALIAVNWWLYIWAVTRGHIVEASLGYFINPLVNVLLGVVVLGERLTRLQRLAVSSAAAGVLYLAVQTGAPPWIALTLAVSFSVYGLIRKTAAVDSLPALGFENAVLVVPMLLYLAWALVTGVGVFGRQGAGIDALLVLSGLVTAAPLALFAYGAQRIPYSLVGILQYLSPTLQLACGVLLYDEPFTSAHVWGFVCIWLALALYAADGFLRLQKSRRGRVDPVGV
jgi:chloramphenicol-sensitive protein RarD